jgi:transposase
MVNIDQLYAQALYLLNNKFQYWFNSKEVSKINEVNKKFQITNPEEEILIKKFTPYEIGEKSDEELQKAASSGVFDYMTATEIYAELQRDTSIRLSHVKMGQFLKNLGFKQISKKINGKTNRVYLVKKDTGYSNEKPIF